MAILGTFYGLDAATLQELKADFILCLKKIAIAGQSYTIGGTTFTRADMKKVADMIGEIQAALDRANGTRRTTSTVASFKSPY